MAKRRRAAGEDLRDRRAPRLARARRARRSTTRTPWPNVSPERLERYFLRSGDALPGRARPAPDDRLRAAQRHQGRAVHARRPRDLPQPAHLPAAGGAAEGAGLFHFALNRGGVLFLGPSETRRRRSPTTSRSSTSTGASTASTSDARIDVDARLQPARGGLRRPRLRRRSTAAATPYSLAQLLGTYDALLEEFMPPSLLRQRPRRARSRVRRREPVPARARRSAGARRARRGRSRAADACSSAALQRALAGARRRSSSRACASRRGRRARLYNVTLERVATAGRAARRTCSSRSRPGERSRTARSRGGAPRSTSDQVSREQLARARGRARRTPRRTCRRRSRSSRRATRSSRPRTRSCSPRTRSCRARTKSSRASTRSSTRSTPSTSARSRADRADERHGQPAREHGVGTLFLDSSSRSASSRRRSPRPSTCSRRTWGARSRRSRTSSTTPSSSTTSGACSRRASASSASSATSGGRPSSCASCPTARRAPIDGVVLTLIDVSGLKAAEDALFHERYLLEQPALQRPRRDLLQGRARAVHPRQRRDGDPARAGAIPGEAVGKTALELPDQEPRSALHQEDEAVLRTGRGAALQPRASAQRPDGTPEWDLVDPAAAARPVGTHRRHHRRLPRRHASRSGPRRRSRRPCAGATSSWRCSRTSCATRWAPS